MPTPASATDNTASLLRLLGKLIPLVDGLADKLRLLLLILLGLMGWFGVYLAGLQQWGWSTLFVLALVALPLLVLARIYAALRGIQALPDSLDEVSDDLAATWRELKSGQRNALNTLQQAKNLWEVKSLLGGADNVLGHYINLGALLNPFFLLLGVISLLLTLPLLLAGVITLLLAIF